MRRCVPRCSVAIAESARISPICGAQLPSRSLVQPDCTGRRDRDQRLGDSGICWRLARAAMRAELIVTSQTASIASPRCAGSRRWPATERPRIDGASAGAIAARSLAIARSATDGCERRSAVAQLPTPIVDQRRAIGVGEISNRGRSLAARPALVRSSWVVVQTGARRHRRHSDWTAASVPSGCRRNDPCESSIARDQEASWPARASRSLDLRSRARERARPASQLRDRVT